MGFHTPLRVRIAIFVDLEALPVSNDTMGVASEKEYQEGSRGNQQEQPGAKIPEQKDSVKS